MRNNHLNLASTGTWKTDHQRHSPNYTNQRKRYGRQGKNTLNTTKTNTTPTKTSVSTTTRLEQPSIDEAEENDLKINFRRMFEAPKEEMKNSLKEMEKNTNKKIGRNQQIP